MGTHRHRSILVRSLNMTAMKSSSSNLERTRALVRFSSRSFVLRSDGSPSFGGSALAIPDRFPETGTGTSPLRENIEEQKIPLRCFRSA